MVTLHDIFSVDELNNEIAAGYVTSRANESATLEILNYTPKAQYDNRWNDVTKACRGLIYDVKTLEVVARPFEKFFNHNQELAPDISDAKWFTVMDKADGSLIVTAVHNGELIVATRGSFMSEQAFAAREILAKTYWCPPEGVTYTFELVGPGNRIVLAYPEDTLIHLGKIDNESGRIYLPEDDTPFDSVQTFSFESLTDVFSAPPRPNAEGYVIYTDKGLVKWKQEDYIELHRIIFNLTPKNIWRAMLAGKSLAEIKEPFPDEFYDEINGIWANLEAAVMLISDKVFTEYNSIDPTLDRKSFAAAVKKRPRQIQGLLFALKDGKNIRESILRMVEPKGDKPRVEEE